MPAYTYPEPGEYAPGTRFFTEPWKQGIMENDEHDRIQERTVHKFEYKNSIFDVKEAVNSRNFMELPVMQYEQMFVCGCESEKIFIDIHKLAQDIVQEINENEYKEITLLELGSGGLLGAFQVLTHILESTSLEYIHVVFSDFGYSEDIWGTYRLLPLGYEAELPNTPRIFRTELRKGTEVAVLWSQDICKSIHLTTTEKEFDPRARKYEITDEKRGHADFRRMVPFNSYPSDTEFGFKEDWSWHWNHTSIHSFLRLINQNWYMNNKLDRTWIDVSVVGSLQHIRKQEQFDEFWGEQPNLFFYDIHMDYDVSKRLGNRLLSLYPKMHTFHAYDMQAAQLQNVSKRVPNRLKDLMKRALMVKF